MFVPVKSLEEALAAVDAGLLWKNTDLSNERTRPRWLPVQPDFRDCIEHCWNENYTVSTSYQRRDFAVYLED